MRHELGVDNLLWGSDFPHPAGTWPYTETCLRHAFHDIPQDETGRILGENAVDFYGFDREVLTNIAGRIGPRPETVARALGRAARADAAHNLDARPSDALDVRCRGLGASTGVGATAMAG